MTALVFGEADPKDYMEPLCRCGHVLSEHYGPNGEPPGDMAPCWANWTGVEEGCECLRWRERTAVIGDPV